MAWQTAPSLAALLCQNSPPRQLVWYLSSMRVGCSEFSASIEHSNWVISMTGCASHNSSELSRDYQWGRGQRQDFIQDNLGYTRRHAVVSFRRWLYSFIGLWLRHCPPLSETHLCMFCVQVSKSNFCKGLRTWSHRKLFRQLEQIFSLRSLTSNGFLKFSSQLRSLWMRIVIHCCWLGIDEDLRLPPRFLRESTQ